MEYRYQFNKGEGGDLQISREAADPSMVCFKGRYYLFASMTLEVWESCDMVNWKAHRLPDSLPLYDYAPDVRVVGEYLYFSASHRGDVCHFYRTKDVLNGPYEKIEGTFDFWDPNLFSDDDGRVYFYWCYTNIEPLYGVELDPTTMKPLSEKKPLIFGDPRTKGFERSGDDHSAKPLSPEELDAKLRAFLATMNIDMDTVPSEQLGRGRAAMDNNPFIEGAWLTKHNGKYYLQYACPGTEYNVYADGVYEAAGPLGPFVLAKNNPYSYKPGGFINGAGHGSTMWDSDGNLWHAATMRISVNHNFERRVGIFPAGFDAEGELYCDQRYGDWPQKISDGKAAPFAEPEWLLLSYGAKAAASSSADGHVPDNISNEDIRTWWKAATNMSGEWVSLDLGQVCDVHAVQVNFADDKPNAAPPADAVFVQTVQPRYIDERKYVTRWKLTASEDGVNYFTIADKSRADTNLPHDFIVIESGCRARYLRLTIYETPFNEAACISGLRVFGKAAGEKPQVPTFTAKRTGDLDMEVSIDDSGADGYNILWGHSPEKLYHSYMTFELNKKIGALVKGQDYFVRVDAFNKYGITAGTVMTL
jgi:hypothetical protein